VVEHDKDGAAKDISLSADKFIDSVDLDKVVVRISNNSENKTQINNAYLAKYVDVVEVDAVEAMNKLKSMRTTLSPDVSRWFGAVQRIVGVPKEGEPFRNYLQRAMSMKSEVDDNLNNPGQENIENALREVVPMLKDAILGARNNGEQVDDKSSGKNKIGEEINKNSQLGAGDLLPGNVLFEGGSVKKEEVESVGDLDQIIAAINNDENTKETEKIYLSEYLEVVEMNAARAWGKLKRLNAGFSFDVKKWLGVVQLTIGVPNETESLREYLQKALDKEVEINSEFSDTGQENIKKVLKAIVPVLHKIVLFDRLSE
jgi:hypothetical protein